MNAGALTDMSAADLRAAALDYAARRWHVLPLHTPTPDGGCSCGAPDCASPGKHPRTPHGLRDATTDPTVIREWWARWPDANIGVLTGTLSGFFVLDVDSDEAAAALKESGRTAPKNALRQRTGRGWQLFFMPPADFVLKNTAGVVADHVDTRGEGGYVVVPPSLHVNGRRYRWQTEGEPGPAPEWLLEALRPTVNPTTPPTPSTMRRAILSDAYLEAALQSEAKTIRQAPEGTRNDTLNKAAFSLGQLEAAGLSHADAEGVLVHAAVAAGLREDEARKTFASGWGNGREPGPTQLFEFGQSPTGRRTRMTVVRPGATSPLRTSSFLTALRRP